MKLEKASLSGNRIQTRRMKKDIYRQFVERDREREAK